MNTRLERRLQLHFASTEARSYLQNKLKSGAYDRLFDNINILDKQTLYWLSEKIRYLINDFYKKAVNRLGGFKGLSEFNFIDYNDHITQFGVYQHFEANLEQFIQKEVLSSGSELWIKIQTLSLELIRIGCKELLDEKDHIRTPILTLLCVNDLTHSQTINTSVGIRKIVKSFAAESVRQVNQSLRERTRNPKARETACGVHAFTAIERGFQQAISRNIRFICQTEDEAQLVVNPSANSIASSETSDSPKSWNRLFNPLPVEIPIIQQANSVAQDVLQFGKRLFGFK